MQAFTLTKKADDFYTTSRAFDFIRFPLIKPYQVMNIPHQNEQWDITMVPQNGMEDIRAGNVVKLSVVDSVIFAVCGDSTIYKDHWVKAAWFIIIPRQKKEESFLSEVDFNRYIKANKLPIPQWIEPARVWNEFDTSNKLPWLK